MPLGGPEFDVETPNIREAIARVKSINPQLATNLRRELRNAGDEIIVEQRKVLAKRPPRVGSSAKKLRLITPSNGDRPYFAFRRVYQPGDTREGGVSNLRERIAAGLRTRVVTSNSREGVELKTTGPRVAGSNMARVWQTAQFRHPVFGDESKWAVQFGQPYFFGPITDELRGRMRRRIATAVDDALAAAGG